METPRPEKEQLFWKKAFVLVHNDATPHTTWITRDALEGEGGGAHRVVWLEPWYKPHLAYMGPDRVVHQGHE